MSARISRSSIPWRELPGLRVKEAAEVIGVAPGTVEGLIERGDLRVTRIGNLRMVLPSSIRELFGEQEAQQAPVSPAPTAHRAAAKRFLKEVSVR